MKKTEYRLIKNKTRIIFSCLILLLQALSMRVHAQGFSVQTVQHISFGAFFLGKVGGTIEVSADGSRTVTGDVIQLNMGIPWSAAIFEVEAPAGTIISIMNGPDVVLSGSNGGSMRLRLGMTEPQSPFSTTVPPPGKTQIQIGGTLTAGSGAINKPGNYTGTIAITFNQE